MSYPVKPFGQPEPDIMVDLADESNKESIPLTAEWKAEIDPLESGFYWYKPPLANKPDKHSTGGHMWAITGRDMQVLASTLPPGEVIVTEPGTFFFGSPDIKFEIECTLCGRGFMEGIRRILGGERCVKVLLKNDGIDEGYVGITPNFPAKILPLQFGKHIPEGQHLIAQRGAYLSHVGEVDVGCDMDLNPITCCFAGLGLFRQKIAGTTDSIAFLNAGGTLVYKDLKQGERIIVDTRSLVAMGQDVSMGITPNGQLCTICFGGEGCCSTTLTGPGKVYIQSMNFNKFSEAVRETVVVDRGAAEEGAKDAATQSGVNMAMSIINSAF